MINMRPYRCCKYGWFIYKYRHISNIIILYFGKQLDTEIYLICQISYKLDSLFLVCVKFPNNKILQFSKSS